MFLFDEFYNFRGLSEIKMSRFCMNLHVIVEQAYTTVARWSVVLKKLIPSFQFSLIPKHWYCKCMFSALEYQKTIN